MRAMRIQGMTRPAPAARRAAVLLAAALLLAACGSFGSGSDAAGPTPSAGSSSPGPPTTSPSTRPSTTASSSPPVSASPPVDCVGQVLAGMSEADRVGQLVMLGVDAGGSQAGARTLVRDQHLGGVTFIGRSYDGVSAVRGATDRLQAAADVPLLVATDQEGGQVQVLHGPGFAEMPTALDQGGLAPDVLRQEAASWGRALRRAGVNTDLAPVLDVVPASLGTANQPIGRYQREYGHTAAVVSREGLAFARGLQDAHVVPVVKHFPGLGAVRGNTDVTADVVDDVTSAGSVAAGPFRDAVRAGLPVVMVSSATYRRIDPSRPAMFSPTVVTDLLRERLGFEGVVISDDLGNAASARAFGSVSRRAVAFVAAGGDVVLTVRAADVPVITAALRQQAADDPAFGHRIDQSARRVLELKESAGLLTCSG